MDLHLWQQYVQEHLALMDAGIKIDKPVSGIAMGLISDEKDSNNYAVLSDILGDEDHLGDMDFKVTGTMMVLRMSDGY